MALKKTKQAKQTKTALVIVIIGFRALHALAECVLTIVCFIKF